MERGRPPQALKAPPAEEPLAQELLQEALAADAAEATTPPPPPLEEPPAGEGSTQVGGSTPPPEEPAAAKTEWKLPTNQLREVFAASNLSLLGEGSPTSLVWQGLNKADTCELASAPVTTEDPDVQAALKGERGVLITDRLVALSPGRSTTIDKYGISTASGVQPTHGTVQDSHSSRS